MKYMTALITGGGTGIGRATALRLAAQGCACVVNYSRSEHEAAETVRAIQLQGGDAVAVQADVSDEAAVNAMVKQVTERYGRLDFLVNNAGKTVFVPMDRLYQLFDEHWDSILNVNVKGTFLVSRACSSLLSKSGGAIVNVSSIAGRIGRGSSIPYCVSKGGVDALTKCLARVLAPEVRVNGVAPGIVETRWVEGHEHHVKLQSEGTPLKRVCTPDEVAEVIVALLIDAAFVTGQIITVDGGFTM